MVNQKIDIVSSTGTQPDDYNECEGLNEEPRDAVSKGQLSTSYNEHIPSRKGDNQIHHHQQDTLKPVRLAITDEVVDLWVASQYNDITSSPSRNHLPEEQT